MSDETSSERAPRTLVWTVSIPSTEPAHVQRRLLGLTFVERRLREARRWGVDQVVLRLPEGLDPADLPRADARYASMPDVVPAGTEPNVDPDSEVYAVDLFALVEPDPPYATVLALTPDGSWNAAVRHFRRTIIDTSNAGWVAKTLNKPISLAISTRLANTRVTPNQWSIFNLVVGLGSGLLVAQSGHLAVVAGALLFQLASVFDGVDGEIAKFRLEDSRFGAFLDTFVDNASLLAFLTGAGIHLHRFSPLGPGVLGAELTVAAIGSVAYLALQMHFCSTRLGDPSLAGWRRKFVSLLPPSDPAVRFVKVAGYAMQKDFFSMAFLVVGLTGRLEILLHLVTLAVVLALGCVLYLNTRYGRVLDEGHA